MQQQEQQQTDGSSRTIWKGFAALPYEIVSLILEISAQSYSTRHARNICLVSRSVYARCWPSIHRIIALRTAKQLREFSESIYDAVAEPAVQSNLGQQHRRLERRQDAIQFLYVNNNRDAVAIQELAKDERPEMWMLSIVLAARNLQLLHVEEFWSISYPWEAQEEKPLLAYPLLLLTTHLATLHESLFISSESIWSSRMSSLRKIEAGEDNRGKEWTWETPQPREVTLSALAMLPSHLLPSSSTAYSRLTRLHIYYAKLDNDLISTLMQVPCLTHLRLTRPFSENLSDAVHQLLGGEESQSRIECLIVEAGIYMDDRTMAKLTELQNNAVTRGRLRFIDNLTLQRTLQKASVEPSEAAADETSSTSHVINWVTSSEERGFDHFKARAQGGEGVWRIE